MKLVDASKLFGNPVTLIRQHVRFVVRQDFEIASVNPSIAIDEFPSIAIDGLFFVKSY